MTERVWVVDDNELILRMIFDILSKNGYSVKSFNHPAIVMNRLMNAKLVNEDLPHVMIVDYYMPDLTGTELIKAIKEMGFANISFVGITGRDESEADAEFTKLGVLLLRKPDIHESDMLIRVMRAMIERTKTETFDLKPKGIGAPPKK